MLPTLIPSTVTIMLPSIFTWRKQHAQQCIPAPSNRSVDAKTDVELGSPSQINTLERTSGESNSRNRMTYSILTNGRVSPIFRWTNSYPNIKTPVSQCNIAPSTPNFNCPMNILVSATCWMQLKRPMHRFKPPWLSSEMTTIPRLVSDPILKQPLQPPPPRPSSEKANEQSSSPQGS